MSLEIRMKTTEREKKDGTITKKINLGKIPEEVHSLIINMACPSNTVCDIYSKAIDDLRADYDSGMEIIFFHSPRKGKKTQIWIHEKADLSMRALSEMVNVDHTAIVYTAISRFLDKNKRTVH